MLIFYFAQNRQNARHHLCRTWGRASPSAGATHLVVDNVIRRDNPKAALVRELGLTILSMPQAVAAFGIGQKHSIVIAGTHGKTTTTALAAHLLQHAGFDPGYLIGGALVDRAESFRAGTAAYFVVEGDEYHIAYFDKGPKFLGKPVLPLPHPLFKAALVRASRYRLNFLPNPRAGPYSLPHGFRYQPRRGSAVGYRTNHDLVRHS